jgi:hypothetical protein
MLGLSRFSKLITVDFPAAEIEELLQRETELGTRISLPKPMAVKEACPGLCLGEGPGGPAS